MIFFGRTMSISEFFNKAIFFIPNKLHNYYESPDSKYEIKELKKLMNNNFSKDYTRIIKKRLVKILKNAYKNVPYWKQFVFLRNINNNNVFQILQKLPLLNKQIIRENGSDMWKSGCNLENTGSGTTGATTGIPLKFLYDSAHEPSHQKAFYEYITDIKFSDLNKDGKIISFDGTRPSDEELENNIFWKFRGNGIYGSYSFCCFYMDDEKLPLYIEKLNELQPCVIRGYSNAILNLAKYLSKNKDKMNFSLKAIYITSEYCSRENMLFISDIFNCKCYGQYGQSEALHFAWTNANNDEYIVSPFYGYVEVVDDNGNHVKEGEIGELCVTSLSNNNQPFIRYLTGDRVTYGGTQNGIVRITNLQGRKADYLIGLDNEKYYTVGWLDVHYMKNTNAIKSYQFEQKEKGTVLIRLVVNEQLAKRTAIEDEFKKLLALHNFTCSFEYLKEIPLTKRGKQKIVIQNITI